MIKTRADLFEAAAKMMRMCDEAEINYAFKVHGVLFRKEPDLGHDVDYEFPVSVVEGKPVFVGDALYYGTIKAQICDNNAVRFCDKAIQSPIYWHLLSWNSQKPETDYSAQMELLKRDFDRATAEASKMYIYNNSCARMLKDL